MAITPAACCLFFLFIPMPQDPGKSPQDKVKEEAGVLQDPEKANEAREGEDPLKLEDIVVTATRTERTSYDTPSLVNVISGDDIRHRRVSRTLPEAMRETPGVMVQKTGHGQGSPFIRGFTGFRTLLLIDGIRLNNSVFRDGPNQYWNTVDPLSVERLEVVKGPSSVLYGSDAIGGTVNAITKGPTGYGEGFRWNGELYSRAATAEQSLIGRAELSASLDQALGVFLGGSAKDFDDLRGGDHIGRQRKTGYEELDGDFKFEYFPEPDAAVVIAHQRVNQDDAWRSHKTVHGFSWHGTTAGDEQKRILDQDRELTYLQYRRGNLGGFADRFMTGVSYHVQSEGQHRIRDDGRSERQGFDVRTFGAMLQLGSPSRLGLWTYGAEYYRDSVNSYKRKYNADGSLDGISIQGPVADDASYDLVGIYLQDSVPLTDRLELVLGTRYTYANADANDVEDPVTGAETSVSDHWSNAVGSARFLYDLDLESRWRLFGGVSQGFRAPNLSDLTRFDTARTDEIETPAPDLDPEDFTAFEVGVKSLHENWSGQVSYHYTLIHDMIVRAPTGRIIDGDAEVTKKNAGDGYLHGIEAGATCRIYAHLSAFANFTWMDGEVDGYPDSTTEKEREPISRLMPITTDLGLRWSPEEDGYWIEGMCTIADKQDDLSARDQEDTQRIPPGGTPGYTVYTIRGGWRPMDHLVVAAALENITDKDYRIHGSGVNEPGRNFVLSMTLRF